MTRNVYAATSALLLVICVGVGVYALSTGFFTGSQAGTFIPAVRMVHRYNDPGVPLSDIVVRVIYAVPANKATSSDPNWKSYAGEALQKASRFHAAQFHGLSRLSYDVYPEPFILEHDNMSYDTEVTNRGNPKGLVSISEEIERRLLKRGGNLYREPFSANSQGKYYVIGIIYEGVGESGGVIYESDERTSQEIAKKLGIPEYIVYKVDIDSSSGFFLINKAVFALPDYKDHADSLLYHEIAHTLGFPDFYDASSNTPSSDDIMGAGRNEPLDMNYIDRSILANMGVL